MTLAEFKAWFDGFTESMDGAPDAKQWKRIKARVKEIDGVAITKTVFVDRYVPSPYRPWWEHTFTTYGMSAPNTGSPARLSAGSGINKAVASLNASQFDSHNAMMDLGKAEYSAAIS